MRSMKSFVGLALATSILAASPQPTYRRKYDTPPNGNSRRSHKENVRRRKLRRLSKRGRALNFK